MFRLLLRFLGLCLLAAAAVGLIVDTTHSLSSKTLVVTSIGESLMTLLPSKFEVARDYIERHVPPFVWDPVLVDLLRLPEWLVYGVIGALALRLGSKPAPKFGFSSR